MNDITNLIAGFKDFQSGHFRENAKTYETLVQEGQKAKIALIACSDSRVDPAIVLNVEPGSVFMVRNVANLVPPYEEKGMYHGTSAALEYAIKGLDVEHIIVLGHAHCGGIHALLEGAVTDDQHPGFIPQWMSLVDSAKRRVEATLPDAPQEIKLRHCEKGAVLVSLENLMTFPWIRKKVEEKSLRIHGWYVDIENGELLAYDPISGNFAPVT